MLNSWPVNAYPRTLTLSLAYYIYIYIYIYKYVYTSIYLCIKLLSQQVLYLSMHRRLCVRLCLHVFTYLLVCHIWSTYNIHIYMHIYIGMCVCMYVYEPAYNTHLCLFLCLLFGSPVVHSMPGLWTLNPRPVNSENAFPTGLLCRGFIIKQEDRRFLGSTGKINTKVLSRGRHSTPSAELSMPSPKRLS